MNEPYSIEDLETPALLIDMDAMEWNIRTMAGYWTGRKAKLRPHFKTAKCPQIARMQMDAGAVGITCAKTGEAEVLAEAGIRDILVANQVVDPNKIRRLAGMARTGIRITVAADNKDNVADLSDAAVEAGTTLHILIEADVGMGRCGVNTPAEVLDLARKVIESPGLAFEGIQAYEGHIVLNPERKERVEGVRRMIEKIGEIKDTLERSGIPVISISGGGTGTYDITGDNTIWTEIQSGSYVFMDNTYSKLGLGFKSSLSVLATVIHKRSGIAVTDTGRKSCSTDMGMPVMKGNPELKIRLNEEHGIIEDENDILQYKQKVEYIPGHCCTTVNLHDNYFCTRAGCVEAVWPISARGKSR